MKVVLIINNHVYGVATISKKDCGKVTINGSSCYTCSLENKYVTDFVKEHNIPVLKNTAPKGQPKAFVANGCCPHVFNWDKFKEVNIPLKEAKVKAEKEKYEAKLQKKAEAERMQVETQAKVKAEEEAKYVGIGEIIRKTGIPKSILLEEVDYATCMADENNETGDMSCEIGIYGKCHIIKFHYNGEKVIFSM